MTSGLRLLDPTVYSKVHFSDASIQDELNGVSYCLKISHTHKNVALYIAGISCVTVCLHAPSRVFVCDVISLKGSISIFVSLSVQLIGYPCFRT